MNRNNDVSRSRYGSRRGPAVPRVEEAISRHPHQCVGLGISATVSKDGDLCDVAELIKRLRALTLRLLPLEVNVKTINDPTNRIITPLVILSYMEAAGDFGDAVGTSPTPGAREMIYIHSFLFLAPLLPPPSTFRVPPRCTTQPCQPR